MPREEQIAAVLAYLQQGVYEVPGGAEDDLACLFDATFTAEEIGIEIRALEESGLVDPTTLEGKTPEDMTPDELRWVELTEMLANPPLRASTWRVSQFNSNGICLFGFQVNSPMVLTIRDDDGSEVSTATFTRTGDTFKWLSGEERMNTYEVLIHNTVPPVEITGFVTTGQGADGFVFVQLLLGPGDGAPLTGWTFRAEAAEGAVEGSISPL